MSIPGTQAPKTSVLGIGNIFYDNIPVELAPVSSHTPVQVLPQNFEMPKLTPVPKVEMVQVLPQNFEMPKLMPVSKVEIVPASNTPAKVLQFQSVAPVPVIQYASGSVQHDPIKISTPVKDNSIPDLAPLPQPKQVFKPIIDDDIPPLAAVPTKQPPPTVAPAFVPFADFSVPNKILNMNNSFQSFPVQEEVKMSSMKEDAPPPLAGLESRKEDIPRSFAGVGARKVLPSAAPPSKPSTQPSSTISPPFPPKSIDMFAITQSKPQWDIESILFADFPAPEKPLPSPVAQATSKPVPPQKPVDILSLLAEPSTGPAQPLKPLNTGSHVATVQPILSTDDDTPPPLPKKRIPQSTIAAELEVYRNCVLCNFHRARFQNVQSLKSRKQNLLCPMIYQRFLCRKFHN